MNWLDGAPCGCSLSGRCEKHGRMMEAIHNVWNNTHDNGLMNRIADEADGYGVPGFVPDWSGIRDSSPEAVERMFAVLPD